MSRVSSRRHSVLARGRATAKGVSGAFGSPSFTWVVCLQEPAQRPGPGTGTAAAAAPLQPWAHPHSRSPPGSLAGQSPGCAGRGLQRTAAGAPGHAAGVLPWWRREDPPCVKGGWPCLTALSTSRPACLLSSRAALSSSMHYTPQEGPPQWGCRPGCHAQCSANPSARLQEVRTRRPDQWGMHLREGDKVGPRTTASTGNLALQSQNTLPAITTGAFVPHRCIADGHVGLPGPCC